MNKIKSRIVLACLTLCLCCFTFRSIPALGQESAPKITVDTDGTVGIPAQSVPMSVYLSPEARAIPVSGIGQIEVISLDYREAPANKFPAASEDVAAVYRELLKTHKPKEIGIYGCSAGGMLTAESMAWFQAHSLPAPGGIGVLCASASGTFGGDSSYTANWLGETRMPAGARGGSARGGPPRLGYFDGANMKDPLISPVDSPEVLAKFPPTLVVTGTRGFEMSSAVYTHSQLVKAGVDAELHVWEGLFHGFFYNTDVPESKDCFDVILKFFDRHLAQ